MLVEQKLGRYQREWDLDASEEAIDDVRTESPQELRPRLLHLLPNYMINGDVATRSTDCPSG